MKKIICNTAKGEISATNGRPYSAVLLFMITLFSLFTNSLNAKGKDLPSDSLLCLEIEGKINNAELRNSETFMVELIKNDGRIDTAVFGGKNKFKFALEKNTFYSIRISMEGYVTKLISVNTEVPEESDVIYRFAFETSLLKEEALVHLNKDAAEMPIAIVHFNNDSDSFVYNKKYTSNVKKEMRNTKSFKNKKTPLIYTDSKNRATAYTN